MTTTKAKITIGYTPLVYSSRARGWQEAYGMLGSYHKSFRRAKQEIRYLIKRYASEYPHWAIERVILDKHLHVIHDDPRNGIILAQSKDAPSFKASTLGA